MLKYFFNICFIIQQLIQNLCFNNYYKIHFVSAFVSEADLVKYDTYPNMK